MVAGAETVLEDTRPPALEETTFEEDKLGRAKEDVEGMVPAVDVVMVRETTEVVDPGTTTGEVVVIRGGGLFVVVITGGGTELDKRSSNPPPGRAYLIQRSAGSM